MKAQAIRKHMKDLGYNFAPRPKEFVFYPQSGLKVVAVFLIHICLYMYIICKFVYLWALDMYIYIYEHIGT